MKLVDMILSYLQTHPGSYSVHTAGYQNAVRFIFSANLIFPHAEQLFAPDRFESLRLTETYVTAHPALIQWLAALIDPDRPPVPQAVWLTAIKITAADQLFLEVSFE